MLFKFLKYLHPVNYFNLLKEDQSTVFPKYDSLAKNIQNQIDLDNGFVNSDSIYLDAAWQVVQKGYIGPAETIQFETITPIVDEYRFIRKHFNKLWVYYILVIRLISLHNPYIELKSFFKTRSVKRMDVYSNPIIYSDWDGFESDLLKKQPKVSVIIPTLNRYEYLTKALADLEHQSYKNFEVIIVDQSEPFDESFYNNFNLNINLFYQKEKALWKARNRAIKESKGDFIALYEDDVRVESNWLLNHLKCIDFFKTDISSGVFYPEGSSLPDYRNFFSLSQQFATGNALLYKRVFDAIGLFDRQFEKQRMGDSEFGLRAYLNGFKNVSNPFAACEDVKAEKGGLRQFGSWDAFRTKNIFAPRPVPSVFYLFRKYYGNSLAKFAVLKTLPSAIIPYRFKRNKKMLLLGVFVSVFLLPLILFQVLKSWNLSSNKLKEGAKIEKLS